jgi:hypothetical protein
MSQLLLVGNPAKRRRSSKPRSAAQKAATRKMLAANRSRKNPVHRKRRARVASARKNPVAHRRTRAVVHHKRRTRRNPISAHMGGAVTLVKGAAIGAVGAIGVDALFGFVSSYLPASFSTEKDATGAVNYGYYLAKGATAVAAAMALKKVVGGQRAAQVATGSLTVTLYRAIAGFMATSIPSVKLGMQLNPAQIVAPNARPQLAGVAGMGKYVQGVAGRNGSSQTMRQRESINI